MLAAEHNILIIDDDPITVKVIAQSLKGDFNVTFAMTAEHGLNRAAQAPQPSVILLDIRLPEVDGFEVCRKLKQNSDTQNIPIIFVTAASNKKDQQLGFELGAVDYVTKPIDVLLLKARVKSHARLQHQILQLESLAATDGLTGCANKRKFDELLASEKARAIREKQPLTLLIADVDDFKAFNDNYGHGKGDECLTTIAQVLRLNIQRSTDVVARIGGEEFAIILPNTDESGGIRVAEAILSHLEKLALPHAHSAHNDFVSLSIGLGTFAPDHECTCSEMIDTVDKALYAAKENGKSQFTVV